jgi:hypothetical protein
MLVTTTAEVVRAMSDLLRRADAGLARGAARNAAAGVAVRQARRLEDARTMRDLRRVVQVVETDADDAGRPGPDATRRP